MPHHRKRWLIKAAEWNPEHSVQNTGPTDLLADQEKDGKTTPTNSSNKLWKIQKTLTESSNQINKTWINTAKDRGRWALLEENYTMTSEQRHENNARMTRNCQTIPARYVNGVRLSDEEVANST